MSTKYLKYEGEKIDGIDWRHESIKWVQQKSEATLFGTKEIAKAATNKGKRSIEEYKDGWIVTNSNNTNPQKPTEKNPFDRKTKSSATDTVSALINNTFSPDGLVWLGGLMFGSSLACNALFWAGVTMQVPVFSGVERILMGDVGLIGLLCGGLLISATTTFFQVLPIVGKKSGDSIAKQFIASLFRPDLSKVKGGDLELAEANANIQSSQWRLLGRLWLACTVLEVAAGLIFIGPIMGRGVASLMMLLGFLYSVAGCQLGAHLSVMGDNLRAPKEGRALHRRMVQSAKDQAFNAVKSK
jgi:hypothetical protein